MSQPGAPTFLFDKLRVPKLATVEIDAVTELPADEVRAASLCR